MDNLVCILAVMLLASLCLADSDSTGVLAGSTERVVIALSNSTGLFNANANCTMRVWDSANNLVLTVNKMSSYGDGRFYYDWAVPQDIGTYGILFNCTDSAKGNYTNGGSVYVVPRPFEKAVAHGDAVYSGRYVELASSRPDFDFLGFGPWLLAVVVLVVGALIYSNMDKK